MASQFCGLRRSGVAEQPGCRERASKRRKRTLAGARHQERLLQSQKAAHGSVKTNPRERGGGQERALTASETVGCAWQVRATSSADAPYSSATAASWLSSSRWGVAREGTGSKGEGESKGNERGARKGRSVLCLTRETSSSRNRRTSCHQPPMRRCELQGSVCGRRSEGREGELDHRETGGGRGDDAPCRCSSQRAP